MKRIILLLPIFLMLNSCSQDSGNIENVRLYFNNGAVFCNGKHKIVSGGLFSGSKKIRIGNWEFFHPNGQLEYLQVYNQEGELTNIKAYSERGNIVYAHNKNGNFATYSWYYPNGKVSFEETHKKNEENEDGENSYFIFNEKQYYENGALKSEKENNELVFWDSVGTEIMRVKYDDEGNFIRDVSKSE